MNTLFSQHKYKAPKWMKAKHWKHKPFPKRKPGNITFAEQIIIVILFTIFIMILLH